MADQSIQELIDILDGTPWIEQKYRDAQKQILALGYTITTFFNRNGKDHFMAVKGTEKVYPSGEVARGQVPGYNVRIYLDIHANRFIEGVILDMCGEETGKFTHKGKTYVAALIAYPGKGTIWHVVTEISEDIK